MQDFKSKVRVISRRIEHLKSRISEKKVSKVASSFDKSEVNALDSLLRIAAVYNDARGPGGSHIENTLYAVKDILKDVLDRLDLDPDLHDGIAVVLDRCDESLLIIRNIADHDDTEEHI